MSYEAATLTHERKRRKRLIGFIIFLALQPVAVVAWYFLAFSLSYPICVYVVGNAVAIIAAPIAVIAAGIAAAIALEITTRRRIHHRFAVSLGTYTSTYLISLAIYGILFKLNECWGY